MADDEQKDQAVSLSLSWRVGLDTFIVEQVKLESSGRCMVEAEHGLDLLMSRLAQLRAGGGR